MKLSSFSGKITRGIQADRQARLASSSEQAGAAGELYVKSGRNFTFSAEKGFFVVLQRFPDQGIALSPQKRAELGICVRP